MLRNTYRFIRSGGVITKKIHVQVRPDASVNVSRAPSFNTVDLGKSYIVVLRGVGGRTHTQPIGVSHTTCKY